MSRISRQLPLILDWLDERTGVRELGRRLTGTSLAGHASWSHSPAFLLAALIVLQLVSGVALAFYYSPGTTSSWGSVFHLEEQVRHGSLLRGWHAVGAGLIVVCLALHLLQAVRLRAYRRPREVTWLTGLILIPVVVGFALTGYLLPWDQKGYWATQVATGIMRGTPLVGDSVARVFQGGPGYGNLTLTRFYALHTLVLPLTLGLALGVHLLCFRRHGNTPVPPRAAEERTPWWPNQAVRDLALLALVMLVAGGFAIDPGAGLDAPADPTSDYPPRPEWYFAPLRQLLILFPEPWGSLVIPGAVFGLIALLPWLDSAERPRPLLARWAVLGPLLVAVGLGIKAWSDDLADRSYQASLAAAEHDAALAQDLARAQGIPGEGAGALLWNHPPRRGARLFQVHCVGCHSLGGEGGDEAPDLTGYLSRAWLIDIVARPRDERFFGRTEIDFMEDHPPEGYSDLPALAEFLISQDPERADEVDLELAARGRELYEDPYDCIGCHLLEPGEASGLGPNLGGYGSREWLLAFLRHPDAPEFYGEDNAMPSYADELSQEQLEAVVAYLKTLR